MKSGAGLADYLILEDVGSGLGALHSINISGNGETIPYGRERKHIYVDHLDTPA